MSRSLPIDELLPDIVRASRERGGVVIVAPPGAGKTTRVPPALVDAGIGGGGAVWVLEPRRLAARSAARRVAAERGSEVGGEIGYRVRFDRRAGPGTRVVFATVGVFLRRIQADPFLSGVGAVLFDEFHERSLDLDLAFALARRIRDDARADLILCAMSATGDPGPPARYLGAPILVSEGRQYPVEVAHLARSDDRRLAERVSAAVRRALVESPGDVLVFLPGVGEIHAAARALEDLDADVHELHGGLSLSRQDAALARGPGRKVVLATNVAETSVTVEGVSAVVDTGLVKRLEHDPVRGIDRLALRRVSRSSADQRAGRAGREGPGLCLRLWTEFEDRALAEGEEPEIRRLDLAGPALDLLAFGEADLASFPWFEAPPPASIDRALALLSDLCLLRDGRPTAAGREVAGLPVHPRLGKLMLEGRDRGLPRRAALAAAVLSERDPFPEGRRRERTGHASGSDLLDRVEAIRSSRRSGAVRHVRRTADQLARLMGGHGEREDDDEAFLRAVFGAFADRLAMRRAPDSPRAVLRDGSGVRLDPRSAVLDAELFVAVEIAGARKGRSEALVRQASRVDRGWIPEEDLSRETLVVFDEEKRRVSAVSRVRIDRLVLKEHPGGEASSREIADRLAEAAADRLADALPLESPAVASFLSRVGFLSREMPELRWPVFDEEALAGLLPALCAGRRSFEELHRAPLLDFLRGLLTREQLVALDRHAPERIEVPSGSRIRLEYEEGRPPVLAVRIQEMFGQRETPRVAAGRVPVLLHLLAPNHRPQQVTDDLKSFWKNTYPVVRKELRARYPKHAWPEAPLTAPPEKGPRRRR